MRSVPWLRKRWVARLGEGTVHVALRRGTAILWESTAGALAPTELPGGLTGLLLAAPPTASPRSLHLELRPPVLQRRQLHGLPPVGTAQLRALVAQQVGRFFRHDGSTLVTDARWVGRRAARPESAAVAVAVGEQVLGALIDASRAGGFEVSTITVCGDGVFDLRPPSMCQTDRVREQRQTRRLAAVALVLWIAVLAAGAVRFMSERHAVAEQLDALAAPLEAIRRARLEMDRAEVELEVLDQAARARGQLARGVLKVADALPDSAIITAASLDTAGRGMVSGIAVRPLDIVARLERSGGLRGPRLTGTPVPIEVKGVRWERFTVASDSTDAP